MDTTLADCCHNDIISYLRIGKKEILHANLQRPPCERKQTLMGFVGFEKKNMSIHDINN